MTTFHPPRPRLTPPSASHTLPRNRIPAERTSGFPVSRCGAEAQFGPMITDVDDPDAAVREPAGNLVRIEQG